jgi:hypothetical protein
MSKKLQPILSIVAVVAVILAIWSVRDAVERRKDASARADQTAASRDEGKSGDRQYPRPDRRSDDSDDLPRLKICGRIGNYDPARGAGSVTVSVAKPGTAHPVQTARITAEGTWELNFVPGAPLSIAVSVPGFLVHSQLVATPKPCSAEVYETTLATGPATTLRGTVSDVFGGSIAGADIDVIPQGTHNGYGFEQPVFRTISGDDGEFEILVPANTYVIRGSYPGYSTAVVAGDTRVRDSESVSLVLSPGATVSGRVVAAGTGEGVPDAELRLVPLASAGSSFINYAARADAVSGPDGVFRIDNVGLGSWAVYAKSDTALSSSPTEISVELYEDVQDVVVSVDIGTPVYGTVRERGQDVPIADALVTLQGESLVLTCDPSAADGLFDCGAVPRGRYTAIVSHKQYAGNLLGANVTVGAEPSYLELELERGYTISGHVSPVAKGVPIRVRMPVDTISGADIGFTMMNAFSSAQTDASGNFTIGPLSLGRVTLVAEHAEHGRGEAEVTLELAEAGREVEIALTPAATLSGTITQLGDTQGSSLELVLAPIGEPYRVDGTRKTGAAMYTLPIDELGNFEARGLEAGKYGLSLQHSLGSVEFVGPDSLELADGQHERIELELAAQQQRFAGVVRDADGGLVEGAVVYSAKDGETRTVSDAEGKFSLVAWSEQTSLPVQYHRAGYSTAASDAVLNVGEGNELVVPLESSLEVTHAGVDSGRVVITGKTRIERPASRSGATAIQGLLAGSYQVHVCGDEEYGVGKLDVVEGHNELSVETRPWISAQGLAITPEGEPLVGATVFAVPTRDPCGAFNRAAMASLSDGDSRVTQSDGSFTLSGLPPGPLLLYFIEVDGESPRQLSTTVSVDEGSGTVELGQVQL